LKFPSHADEADAAGDARMGDEFVRETNTAFIVETEKTARAQDRLRLGVVVFAKKRIKRIQALGELADERLAECFERGRNEGGKTINARGVLLSENLPVRRGHTHPALGIELVDDGRDEWLYRQILPPAPHLSCPAYLGLHVLELQRPKQAYGMAWDSMGKDKGSTKKRNKNMHLEEFTATTFWLFHHNIWSSLGEETDSMRTNHKQWKDTVIRVNKNLIFLFYICSSL